MPKLEELVLENGKQQLFSPDRVTSILEALIACRSQRDQPVADRNASLDASRAQVQDKLARLYKAIEDGIVELDQDLKDRVTALKDPVPQRGVTGQL